MIPYYQAGGITLYHGDCREVMASLAQGPALDAVLMLTDPPYGNRNGEADLNASLAAKRGMDLAPIANDAPDTMREVVDAALDLAPALMRRPSAAVVCCMGGGGPTPTFAWLAGRMDAGAWEFDHCVIWDKGFPGLGWHFRRQYEMLMVSRRRGGTLPWRPGAPAVPNIQRWLKPRDGLHPNEKPLEWAQSFIDWMTCPGDLVLDPFMGSGVVGLAARNLGRRYLGIELDERYCERAARRLDQQVLDLVPAPRTPEQLEAL